MQASDYKVTFKFGATTPPYNKTNKHLGEDRKMPTGVNVNVGNTVIGLSGNTGKSTGAHLHIQRVAAGAVLHPQGRGLGNSLAFPATVYEIGTDQNLPIGRYVRIIDAKGERFSYFHLDEVHVKVGQIINAYVPPKTIKKGDEAMPIKSESFIKNMYRHVAGREANAGEIAAHKSGTPESLLNGFIKGGDLLSARAPKQINALNQQILKLNAQVAAANAQAAELAERPTKDVLHELQKQLDACQVDADEATRMAEQAKAEVEPQSASVDASWMTKLLALLLRKKS